ncbi:MAG: GNAT family N-acetyltransferase [Propionibacteriales bacterium]|nr:GNAT family N-acetyltransferase [Propionibacteriales bacterium]
MHQHHMIRRAVENDETSVKELAVVNNMFGVDELDDFVTMFRGALNGELEGHQWYVMVDPDNRVVAAAYVAPEPFADRLWNLSFLAVDPGRHGRGAGSRLIEHVEGLLRDAGEGAARVLIVETSSTDEYANAREFYRARGFDEEARIRDFYGPGDSKVVFWKAMTE